MQGILGSQVLDPAAEPSGGGARVEAELDDERPAAPRHVWLRTILNC